MNVVICWTENGESKWERLCGKAEQAADEWQKRHPGLKAQHQFLENDDLLNEATQQRALFERNCGRFGLSPTDFNEPIKFADGTTGIIRGYEPGRRKYVIRVWASAQQRFILCGGNYAAACRRRYLQDAKPLPAFTAPKDTAAAAAV